MLRIIRVDEVCFCFAFAFLCACRDGDGSRPGRRVTFFCRTRRDVAKVEALNTHLTGSR